MVGDPNDAYEQEADRVADRIMRSAETNSAPASNLEISPISETTVARQTNEAEEQSAPDEDEQETIQLKAKASGADEPPQDVEPLVRAATRHGRLLPRPTLDFFEPRFGQSLDSVRVHIGSRADAAAKALGAKAFTSSTDIVFGANQYAPDTLPGQRLLAHELTHVIQQHGSGTSLLQRDETEESEGRKVVGWWQLLDKNNDLILEISLKEKPPKIPGHGLFQGKVVVKSRKELVFKSEKLPGGEYKFEITGTKKEANDALNAFRRAALVQLVIPVTGEAKHDLGTGEEKQKPKTAPESQAGPEEATDPGTGEEAKEKPPAGTGTGEETEERKSGGKSETTGSPEGTRTPDGRAGSKYGWLDLLELDLSPETIKALEEAFELLGDAEEYLALKQTLQNLAQLGEHADALRQLLSNPEHLVDALLGIEDSSLTAAIDAVGRWVQSRPSKPKRKKKSRAKGLVGIAIKVFTLMDKVRAALGPVFVTRGAFQQTLGLASVALSVPGIEEIIKVVQEPSTAQDVLEEKAEQLKKEATATINEQIQAARQLFELSGGIDAGDLITYEQLGVAVTRAARKFAPGLAKPVLWAAEKVGLLDLVGEHVVSELIPEEVLNGLNGLFQDLLSTDAVKSLAAEAGSTLDEFVVKVQPMVDTALGEILESTIVRRDADHSGRMPSEEDAARAQSLMQRSVGLPMPDALRQRMESSLGADFSDVRLHTDPAATRASRSLHAEAFAAGSDIYFGEDRFRPDSPRGLGLLSHELAHVVQQSHGNPERVQRSASDKAKKYVKKIRDKFAASASAAFKPDSAKKKTATETIKALDKLIGRKVVSGTNPKLPKGYTYVYRTRLLKGKKKGKSGKQVSKPTGIRRLPGFLLYLPPLKIDGKDRVQLNLRPGLGPNAAARAKLRRNMKCAKDLEQAHHVVPLELQDHPLVLKAAKRGWDLNGRENGVCLHLAIHYGSHPGYTEQVRTDLDKLQNRIDKGANPDTVLGDFETMVKRRKDNLKRRKTALD